MDFRIQNLSKNQLQAVDDALEELIFKQQGREQFAEIYRKNPKEFRKLIRLLVAFKKDLMLYFSGMYDDRWKLVNYYAVPEHGITMDQYDPYFSSDWDDYDLQLAQVLEKHKKSAIALGILSMILVAGLVSALTSEDLQEKVTNQSVIMAKAINQVTQNRIKTQLKAALTLNEDRAAFEKRLDQIFNNQYRGRVIAEHEALQSFNDARYEVATENNLQYKTWRGSQLDSNEICGEVLNKTVPIDQAYPNGLMGPLAHIGCKCTEEYSNSAG